MSEELNGVANDTDCDGSAAGFCGLLWIVVIAIIREDRPIDRRNLRDGRGPFVDQLPDDKKAA